MSDSVELAARVLVDIEDRLFPVLGLDVWERAVYYYLLRHTRVIGKTSVVFALAPMGTATAMSDTKAREVIRDLDRARAPALDQAGVGISVEFHDQPARDQQDGLDPRRTCHVRRLSRSA